jgi:glycosyltransferase involved in cell wall biosynthesis
MDGGSTDQTLKILKKYRTKLKYFSASDQGQADALNQGFKLATGEILGFINSDDYYLPGAIQKVVKQFQNQPNIKVISGDYQIINARGERIQAVVRVWKNLLKKFHSVQLFSIANYINQPSTFWRKSVLAQVGEFNSKLHYVFDYEYWLRIMMSGLKFNFISDELSAYRIHPNSKSGAGYKRRAAEELQVQKKFNSSWWLTLLHHCHNQIMNLSYDLFSLGLFEKLR